MTEASDQALVARVLSGDQSAFAALYSRHEPALTRRIRRVLGPSADVEDVLQLCFVEAYRSLGRYDASRPFTPWIHGIAFKQVASHLRRKQRRRWLSYGREEAEVPAVAEVNLEDEAMQRQLSGMLYQAMEGLTPKKRIAFTLHFVEGMGFAEIGEVVGASPQTVRARVLSAKEAVLKQVRRRTQQRPTGAPP